VIVRGASFAVLPEASIFVEAIEAHPQFVYPLDGKLADRPRMGITAVEALKLPCPKCTISPLNRVPDHLASKRKTCFQSFVMLTSVQPRFGASSRPLSSLPTAEVRSYANSRRASSW